jgi:hypothetical protein
MDSTAAENAEAKVIPQTQPKREKQAASPHPVDKFAEARRAKKKAKRMRHRAALKRSHTKG